MNDAQELREVIGRREVPLERLRRKRLLAFLGGNRDVRRRRTGRLLGHEVTVVVRSEHDVVTVVAQLCGDEIGRFDDANPKNDAPVTGRDARAAVDALLAGRRPSTDQHPSIGCSIKWKPGNAP